MEELVLIFLVGHFLIPFVLLMSRLAKRNIKFLVIMAIWLLGMQWVDLYWLVMPNFHHHGIYISWIDFAAWIMVSGFTIHFITRKLKKNALVPIKGSFFAKFNRIYESLKQHRKRNLL
ncbi:MAG: hypothetical protein R3A45_04565 [Bdellovibrionota bacterium]